jgi:hypothetical protein
MNRRNFIRNAGIGVTALFVPYLPALPAPADVAQSVRQKLNDGEWHHFAVARRDTGWYFYIDDELVGEGACIHPCEKARAILESLAQGILRAYGEEFPDATIVQEARCGAMITENLIDVSVCDVFPELFPHETMSPRYRPQSQPDRPQW